MHVTYNNYKAMEMADRVTYEAGTLKVVELKAQRVLCVSIIQDGADEIDEEGGEW